jgi:hypothetical protein
MIEDFNTGIKGFDIMTGVEGSIMGIDFDDT